MTPRREAPPSGYAHRRRGWDRSVSIGITLALYLAGLLLLSVQWYRSPPASEQSQPLVVDLLPLSPDPTPEEPAPEVEEPQRKTPPVPQVPVPVAALPALIVPLPMPGTATAQPERTPDAPPRPPAEPAPAPPPRASPASAGPEGWEGRILARIEQVKRYPSAARVRRQQGVVHVRFRMDRNGRLLFVGLQRSSGNDALDRAALETVRRAEPFPAIPEDRPSEVELAVPVEFFLR